MVVGLRFFYGGGSGNMFHHRVLAGWGLVAAGLLALPVQALQVQKLSPQGVVNEGRQVVLRTDQDAVRFGDPQAAAPAAVTCSDEKSAKAPAAGTALANGCGSLSVLYRRGCAARCS